MAGTSLETRTVVQAHQILEKIAAGEPVDYDSILIEGDLDLSDLNPFIDWSDEMKAVDQSHSQMLVIISTIRITNSRIVGLLSFDRAIFEEDLEFSGTEFGGHVSFAESQFAGYTSFCGSRFCEYADFSESKFSEFADFSESLFLGDAHFVEPRFHGDANFRGAKFQGDAYFSGSNFMKYADFSEALFQGYASFRISIFGGYAYFSDSQFAGDASFNGSHFHEDASFMGARFNKDANFSRSRFEGYSSFMGSRFDEFANFSDVSFERDVYLTEVKLDSLKLRWNSIKDHIVCDGATYLLLVKLYKDLEWFRDSDDCYYQYRSKSQAGKAWSDRSKYLDIVADLTCGYGIRPTRTIYLSISLILIFACISWLGGAHESPLDAVYYSFVAFFSNVSSVGAVGNFRYVFVMERLIGWLLMSLFLVTLGKVMIR